MSLHITLTQPALCWGMDAGDTERDQILSMARAPFRFREVTKPRSYSRSNANSKHLANSDGPWP